MGLSETYVPSGPNFLDPLFATKKHSSVANLVTHGLANNSVGAIFLGIAHFVLEK